MPYDKKIAIVYKSKHGSTMKYAGWLAIKLDADLYEESDVGRWDLLKYKTIVFGGPIYNSKIYNLDYILEKYNTIKNKNIIIFCPNLGLQSHEEIIDYNFVEEEMKEKIKIFFLEGSINYNELSSVDKLLFRRLVNKKKKENKLSYEHINLEKNIDMDRSNKKSIEPILDYIMKKTFDF
ncbi:flavodoxin domain-containing protein [Terrisporobacter sp.]|uniref:flavodoxin domain-containing protein n=1 Tax=Terrisporobacter sp. TaxID=1965305 RepID=UPI00260415F0|nr:flavodoxin domain-containing protein [Terrisporobacter sp.]